MRVLISTSTFPRFPGDNISPFMADLATALAARGIELDILAPHAPSSKRTEQLGKNITVHRFRYAWPEAAQDICYGPGALENLKSKPWRAAKLPFLAAAQSLFALRLVHARKHHVIHAHWLLPQGLTAIPAALIGVPILATAHGSDVFGLQGRWSMRAKRFVAKHAALVTANSLVTASALREIGVNRIEVVPIGAVARTPANEPAILKDQFVKEADPLLLFVGRLIELKGADDAIAALAIVQRRLPKARLVLVGDGPQRSQLEKIANELGIRPKLSFRGWLTPEEVACWMRRADALIVPSHLIGDGLREAQGVVPLEAMLYSLPVIASRSGGLADIVHHEKTGLLVPERSPEAIAEAVLRLSSNRSFAAGLAAKAKTWAETEATMTKTAERFHQIYTRLKDQGIREASVPRRWY